jgi:hypothetical protein
MVEHAPALGRRELGRVLRPQQLLEPPDPHVRLLERAPVGGRGRELAEYFLTEAGDGHICGGARDQLDQVPLARRVARPLDDDREARHDQLTDEQRALEAGRIPGRRGGRGAIEAVVDLGVGAPAGEREIGGAVEASEVEPGARRGLKEVREHRLGREASAQRGSASIRRLTGRRVVAGNQDSPGGSLV